jgi:hypothetical protein
MRPSTLVFDLLRADLMLFWKQLREGRDRIHPVISWCQPRAGWRTLVAPIFNSWCELPGQALPRGRSLQPLIGETRNDPLELCAIVLRDHRPPELRSEPEHEHEGPPPKPSGIVGTDAQRMRSDGRDSTFTDFPSSYESSNRLRDRRLPHFRGRVGIAGKANC